MLTIMDCNNFWSPSGGGVRRYHLQKIDFFKTRNGVRYVFVMQDDHDETEKLNDSTFIEHVKASKIPGNWEYRFLASSEKLAKIFCKYKPDLVEVGSPYLMPWLVKRARKKAGLPDLKVVGFWHADYPVTYVRRFFCKFGHLVATLAERLTWLHARAGYRWMDAILVSSPQVEKRMNRRGLNKTRNAPLGVDAELFHPGKKDAALVRELKAGETSRLSIFFPHRFQEEKGVRTLIAAYPLLCRELNSEPALIFAGTGPDLDRVRNAAEKYEHVRYLGFVKSRKEMARWTASCEMGMALSGWETFGLSILEAMASGQVFVGADSGAAKEHILDSHSGEILPPGRPHELARAIATLAQSGTLDNKSTSARNYAENFTWQNCFQRELEIYREILSPNPHEV